MELMIHANDTISFSLDTTPLQGDICGMVLLVHITVRESHDSVSK